MKRFLSMICIAAFMLALFPPVQAEKIGPSARMRSYNAGKYEVGKTLDAGEYILFSAPMQTGFFAVIADMESMDLISTGSFESNTFLTVEEGDWLIIADCIAIFASDYYSMRKIILNESGGMLKVGVDISPGEYNLRSTADMTAVYRIYNDSRYRLVVEEKEFRNTSRVTVEEGQYLELIHCFDQSMVPDSTPTPKPASTPKPTPNATTAPVPEPSEGAPASENSKDSSISAQGPTPESTSVILRVKQIVRIDPRKSPNVRSIPSTRGTKLGVAKAGAEYELLEISEKWYKIRLDTGIEGWVIAGMAEIVK